MADLVPQLSAVVTDLRRPSIDAESRKHKLRGVFYCLPLIKNKQNLWVLLRELALSPSLFNATLQENIETILYAVDGVQFACERKNQITSPTLSPKDWIEEIVHISHALPPLIGLVLVSGLAANNQDVVASIIRCANAVTKDPSLVLLAAACLARAQWSYRITPETYQYIERPEEMLRMVTGQILFTPENLSLTTPAMTAQLGSWSRLVSGLLLVQSLPALLKYAEAAQLFVRTVVAHGYDPETMKPLFFGIMIQLEGLANQILTSYRLHSRDRAQLVILVLEILQPLGYVTQSVGSRFDSYQFVFNSCLDTLSDTSNGDEVRNTECAVNVISILGSHWAFGQPITSDIAAGDLVVFFEIAEQLMPVLPTEKAEQLVLPTALRFLDFADYVSVFEAAHSLVLAYLATHHSFKYSKAKVAVSYFDRLLWLFPGRLSATQFRTAVEAVMRAVDDKAASYVLEELYKAAKRSVPGLLLQPVSAPEAQDSVAPTLRAALVSSLLHAAAERCHAVELSSWLKKISSMVPQPYSTGTEEERKYLIKDFRAVTTSLGSETSDVGIKWFFNDGWSRL